MTARRCALRLRPTIALTRRGIVHWQLVWFSMLSILAGWGFLYRALWADPTLPAGPAELPPPWLLAQCGVWLAAGFAGIACAAWFHGAEAWMRRIQGVLCVTFAGALFYGWIFQGYTFGWYGTFLFLFIGCAILAPSQLHVTIHHRTD